MSVLNPALRSYIRADSRGVLRTRSIGLLALAAMLMLFGRLNPNAGTCLLLYHTGLPCPLCGGTRALSALSSVHLGDALARHAPITILVLGLLILGVTGTISAQVERRQVWTMYIFAGGWGWFWLGWYLTRAAAVLVAGGLGDG